MPDVEFESGAFHAYRATETINVGAIDTQTSGYNVQKDEVFRYDGDTIILKDGREFGGITQLRGAIKAGWFVPAADTTSVYRAKTANIQVAETEQRGQDRAPKHPVVVEDAEEQVAGTVDARRKDREAKHAAISSGLPVLESPEAQAAVAARVEESEDYVFDCGDEEMNEIGDEMSAEMNAWWAAQFADVVDEESEPVENVREKIETDMLSMFSMLDDMGEEVAPAPVPRRKAPPKAAPKKAVKTAAADKKFPVQAEERLAMPIKNGDEDTENAGTVVRTIVEREQSTTLNIAAATPQARAAQPPRPGNSGVIVVDEDQRDVGRISLSREAAGAISMEDRAKVKQASTDSVRMSAEAEVGGRKKMETMEADSGGVAVGRIKSPTHRSFVASDANTNSSAIERTEQGKQLEIERLGKVQGPVATGDVQEARSGETLDELLPDAASTPAPKVYLRPEEDPAYQAIKMLIPDFAWDKDRRWQDRVEDAMKFIKKPQYLKGILAVETETVREEIKKRLAEVLAGDKVAG